MRSDWIGGLCRLGYLYVRPRCRNIILRMWDWTRPPSRPRAVLFDGTTRNTTQVNRYIGAQFSITARLSNQQLLTPLGASTDRFGSPCTA